MFPLSDLLWTTHTHLICRTVCKAQKKKKKTWMLIKYFSKLFANNIEGEIFDATLTSNATLTSMIDYIGNRNNWQFFLQLLRWNASQYHYWIDNKTAPTRQKTHCEPLQEKKHRERNQTYQMHLLALNMNWHLSGCSKKFTIPQC